MHTTIEKYIKLILIFSSIYYIPYLLFGWVGMSASVKSSAPFYYQVLQMIFPAFLFILYNIKKFRFKLSFEEIIMISLLIFIIFKIIIFKFDSLYLKSVGFFLFYILIPKINIIELNLSKTINIVFLITLFTLLLEIFVFPLFNIRSPFYINDYFSRFIGNFGGPNILGLSGVCFFTYYYTKYRDFRKIKLIINSLISIFIIIASASLSSFFTLFFMILWINFINIKNIKRILQLLFISIILLIILYVIFNYYNDKLLIFERFTNLFFGNDMSANSRLNFITYLKNMNFIEHIFGNMRKYIKVETSILQIYINYGMIVSLSIIILIIKKILYFIKRKNYYNYRLLLNIMISVIIISFINPVIFIFPYIFLFPLFLKIE